MSDQPGTKPAPDKPFLSDIQTLRARARKHMEQGAVTEGYRADRETVVKVLNEALATEIVCVLRYRRHYFMSLNIPMMNRDTLMRLPSESSSLVASRTSIQKAC